MRQRTQHYYYLKMQTHYIAGPYADEARRVRVLLPKDYDKETWASYPVVYMLDGQNVFYSKEAFSGHSWKVIPTIKHQVDLPKCIVVGIDNAGEKRLDEYGPWQTDRAHRTLYEESGGDGMQFGEWLVSALVPFIDQEYRTTVDERILIGSSMGGLMTAYLGAAYPNVFTKLGVFSLASWFSERDFLRFIAHHPVQPDARIYVQVGTDEGDETDSHFMPINEMSQQYIDTTLRYYNQLIDQVADRRQIALRILAGEKHHEKYWALHFGECLRFLLQ